MSDAGDFMMKTLRSGLLLPAAAAALWATTAVACDDHIGKCKIKDWKPTYTGTIQALTIDGVATCDEGKIMLQLYDGEGDAEKFIGVDTAYIRGHIFKAIKLNVEEEPHVLFIKYSIKPD